MLVSGFIKLSFACGNSGEGGGAILLTKTTLPYMRDSLVHSSHLHAITVLLEPIYLVYTNKYEDPVWNTKQNNNFLLNAPKRMYNILY